jgi:tRNA-dihydrouridine synthase
MGAKGFFKKFGNIIIMTMRAMENNPRITTNRDIYMYLEKCSPSHVMDGLVPILEAMKTGDKHRDYCVDDAVYHIKKASEALTDGLKDPEAWYNTSQAATKVLAKSLPFILALQIVESLDGQKTPEEN